MKRTVTLSNPIKVNGKEIKELSYDVEKITTDQFLLACAKAADPEKNQSSSFKAKENDYVLHMYLGFMAVIAENPEIAVEDLERVKGYDVMKFASIGFLFTVGKLEEESDTEESEDASETTAATSTQASQTSEE